MKKEQPKLKRIKIDDIIRATKSTQQSSIPRARGRPKRSDPHLGNPSSAIRTDGNAAIPNSSPSHPGPATPTLNPAPITVVPQYDTTEEAKGFLRTPFEAAAGLTNIPTLNLLPAELEALMPSWKVVYDKRIAPNLGSNADLIAFGMVAGGILFNKYSIYKVEAKRIEIAKKNSPMRVADVKPTSETPQFVIPTQSVCEPIPLNLDQ